MIKVSRRLFMKAGAAIGLIGAPATAQATASVAPLPSPAEHPFKWWVSYDGGEVYRDECETREQALEIARSYANSYGDALIAECQQQDFDLRIEGYQLIELMQDSNDELIGEGDFIDCTSEQVEELEREVNAVIFAWDARHKINRAAWTFGNVRNKEEIKAPRAGAEMALNEGERLDPEDFQDADHE